MAKKKEDRAPLMDSSISYYKDCAFNYFGEDKKLYMMNKDTVNYYAYEYTKAIASGDDAKRNACFSAIMVIYQYVIMRYIARASGTEYDYTTYVNWLEDALLLAFQYHAWDRAGNKELTPYSCISVCIETVRKRAYQEYNRHPETRSEYGYCLSLDSPCKVNDEDLPETLLDRLSNREEFLDSYENDNEVETRKRDSEIFMEEFVQSLVNENKIVQAVIVDLIALSNDPQLYYYETKVYDEKNDTSYKKYEHRYKPSFVLNTLKTLKENKEYQEYFKLNYGVPDDVMDVAVRRMSFCSKQYRSAVLDNTMAMLKKPKYMKKLLGDRNG